LASFSFFFPFECVCDVPNVAMCAIWFCEMSCEFILDLLVMSVVTVFCDLVMGFVLNVNDMRGVWSCCLVNMYTWNDMVLCG
jgi:hypothetical protein